MRDPLEESAEDLYEHAPCGYLSTDPAGTIVRVNRTFLAWTGYAREDLVGRRRFPDLLPPGGRIYHETHVSPLLQMQGEVREIAAEIACADGRRLPVLVNSVLRRDAHGAPVLVRTTVFDATDRRSYERELLHARRQERAARERVERLQALTAALSASHDPEHIAQATLAELASSLGADAVALTVPGGDGPPAEVRHGDADLAEAATVVELPLATGTRQVGAIRVGFLGARELGEEERTFADACAGQCAQALERAGLHEATRVAAARTALLADVSRLLDEAQTAAERGARLVERLVPDLADLARLDVPATAEHAAIAASAGDEAPAAEDSGSRRALALRARGRALGTLVLARRPGRPPLRTADLPFLHDLADRAALAIENALLFEQERRVAHRLQRSMLAGAPPQDARFAVATLYRPAVETLEVGGDWYDTVEVDASTIAVIVGDVVGRGIEAASAMGQLRSAIRALAGATPSPGRLVERLDGFVDRVDGARMATLAYAELALGTGRLRLLCAGHPPPVLLAPGRPPEFVWSGRSAPLGAYVGTTERQESELVLAPGSRFLLYTDGLVERRDRPLDAGLDALLEEVGRRRDAPLSTLVEELPGALQPADHRDDVCVLALAYGAATAFERVVSRMHHLEPLRTDLRAWLVDRAVGADEADAIVLAGSEAVANSIEHGHRSVVGAAVRVWASVTAGVLTLRVRDQGRWRGPRGASDRGRGLDLIGRLMDAVEIERGDGTSVTMRRRVGEGGA